MHAYVVRPGAKVQWKDQTLVRGDIVFGDDAREMEAPEHRHLHHHLTRVPEAVFQHLFSDASDNASATSAEER